VLRLSLLDGLFAVCRLSASEPVPGWAQRGPFFSISRTPEELSIVCEERAVPSGVKAEAGWRCLKVEGPLDFSVTGVLSSIAGPLADAKVSLFAVSTFDTDYLLVKESDMDSAIAALKARGHAFEGSRAKLA